MKRRNLRPLGQISQNVLFICYTLEYYVRVLVADLALCDDKSLPLNTAEMIQVPTKVSLILKHMMIGTNTLAYRTGC